MLERIKCWFTGHDYEDTGTVVTGFLCTIKIVRCTRCGHNALGDEI